MQSKTAHCATCGKRRQLSYPRGALEPICCTQRCAAAYLLILIDLGATHHCGDCGGFDCQGECEE